MRVPPLDHKPPSRAIEVATLGMTMRFGSFTALNDVSIKIAAGSFHVLLGENGAGKSTLVKCMMGFYRPTSGQMTVEGMEADVPDPRAAHDLGLGMVYQHFTLVPSLTAAENLVISRTDVPARIQWDRERADLAAFMKKNAIFRAARCSCRAVGGRGKAEAGTAEAALSWPPFPHPR